MRFTANGVRQPWSIRRAAGRQSPTGRRSPTGSRTDGALVAGKLPDLGEVLDRRAADGSAPEDVLGEDGVIVHHQRSRAGDGEQVDRPKVNPAEAVAIDQAAADRRAERKGEPDDSAGELAAKDRIGRSSKGCCDLREDGIEGIGPRRIGAAPITRSVYPSRRHAARRRASHRGRRGAPSGPSIPAPAFA